MNSKLAIFAVSFIAVGSISGIALGRYATTATTSGVIREANVSDASDSFDATLTSPIGTTTEMLTPDHIPVCRKGCGPTLSERKEANYYGDEYSRKLDAIYRDDQDYSSDDSLIAETASIASRSAYPESRMARSVPVSPPPTVDTLPLPADVPSAANLTSDTFNR